MAATTALSWAFLAIALKFSLQYFSSGTIVWVRMSVATALLLAGFALFKRSYLEVLKNPPWLGLLGGVMMAGNYFGFMKGVELTSASNAQVMIQLAPMGFAFSSIYLFNERPGPWQFAGLMTAVFGFAFFYWDQILVSVVNIDRFQEGNLWLFFAAITWMIFALAQKQLLKTQAPQKLNLLIYAISTILLWPTVEWSELNHLTLTSAGLLVFLSFNTIVAYGALSEAIRRIPATHVSVIIAMNPLLTLVIMTYLTQMQVTWISGEPIHWRGFLGAVLVVTGVVVVVTSPKRL